MNITDLGIGPSEVGLALDENVASSKNPFTGGSVITRMPGAKWNLTASWTKLDPGEANFMDAYIAASQGGATKVRVPDLSYTHPQGARVGTVSVRVAAVDGNQLQTQGWAANQPGQLKVGDRFSFIDATTGLEEMHIISADVNSDASGYATLNFYPELKRLPGVGVSINILTPGFTALVTKSKCSRSGMSANASFTWEEALYAV